MRLEANDKVKVLTIGWHTALIEQILRRVENESLIEFYHFVQADVYHDLKSDSYYTDKLSKIPDERDLKGSAVDLDLLSKIEKCGSFTLNNLILSDRVIKHLKYQDALVYLSAISTELSTLYDKLKPAYVIGSWDSVLQGVAYLTARHKGIPFYVLKFSVIPSSHLAICDYPNPNAEYAVPFEDDDTMLISAEKILDQWMQRDIVAPAYVSVRTTLDIFKKLPFHFRELSKRIESWKKFGTNRFINYSIAFLVKEYLRKKSNIVFTNPMLFIDGLPKQPFFFYGLHMQPESSIDVWAPFYSDQFRVIEAIARSMPIENVLCVKIHISDADNYSSKQIRQLLNIPGVRIVSPLVSSREFIENAQLIFSIQGTIGLEGALLGKPTIMFGDSPVEVFPSVAKVGKIEQLPDLVKYQIAQNPPSKRSIVEAFSTFLKNYMPSSSDDWSVSLKTGLTQTEINNYVNIFTKVAAFSQRTKSSGDPETAGRENESRSDFLV